MSYCVLIVEKEVKHQIHTMRICRLARQIDKVVAVTDMGRAFEIAKKQNVDFMIINLSQPCGDKIQQALCLKKSYPKMKFAFTFSKNEISMSEAHQCAFEAHQLPAFAFFEKPCRQEEIVTALEYEVEKDNREI